MPTCHLPPRIPIAISRPPGAETIASNHLPPLLTTASETRHVLPLEVPVDPSLVVRCSYRPLAQNVQSTSAPSPRAPTSLASSSFLSTSLLAALRVLHARLDALGSLAQFASTAVGGLAATAGPAAASVTTATRPTASRALAR